MAAFHRMLHSSSILLHSVSQLGLLHPMGAELGFKGAESVLQETQCNTSLQLGCTVDTATQELLYPAYNQNTVISLVLEMIMIIAPAWFSD